jgi:hypothetical protein
LALRIGHAGAYNLKNELIDLGGVDGSLTNASSLEPVSAAILAFLAKALLSPMRKSPNSLRGSATEDSREPRGALHPSEGVHDAS